jgi:hypothetical protein
MFSVYKVLPAVLLHHSEPCLAMLACGMVGPFTLHLARLCCAQACRVARSLRAAVRVVQCLVL